MSLVIRYIESGIEFCHDKKWDYCSVGITLACKSGRIRFDNCYDARRVLPVQGHNGLAEFKFIETIKLFTMLNVVKRTRC